MPELPPLEMVGPALLFDLLIPAIAAAIIFALAHYSLPKPLGTDLGAVVGFLAAFAIANHFREAIDFRLPSKEALNLDDWWHAFRTSFWGASEGETAPPPARYWLGWTVPVAAVLGLAVRFPRLAPDFAAFYRIALIAPFAYVMVGERLRQEHAWAWPAFTAMVAIGWQTWDRLGKSSPGGWLPALAMAQFTLATGIAVQAQYSSVIDAVLIPAGCFLGLAAVAWFAEADASAAAPFSALALPGLMLVLYQASASNVPALAYLFAGSSSVALSLMLLAPSDRRAGRLFVALAWAAALAPLIVGLVLAIQAPPAE